jgi:septal ring factor EnvC (AmiA/AmiB activator)
MTITDTYTSVASQAREVTDRSVDAWKRSAKTVVEQATAATKLPTVDLVQPIERYFEYVQRSVDVTRDLATKWAESVANLSGVVREQAERISNVVVEQADTVGNLVNQQAETVEHVVDEQAQQVERVQQEQARLAEKAEQERVQAEQARQAEQEQAEKEQARQARAAERAEARAAHAKAREQYENLTKAELADQLAERGLPKSGNVDELIERLVSADSE